MERLDREFPQWGRTLMLPFPENYLPPYRRLRIPSLQAAIACAPVSAFKRKRVTSQLVV